MSYPQEQARELIRFALLRSTELCEETFGKAYTGRIIEVAVQALSTIGLSTHGSARTVSVAHADGHAYSKSDHRALVSDFGAFAPGEATEGDDLVVREGWEEILSFGIGLDSVEKGRSVAPHSLQAALELNEDEGRAQFEKERYGAMSDAHKVPEVVAKVASDLQLLVLSQGTEASQGRRVARL